MVSIRYARNEGEDARTREDERDGRRKRGEERRKEVCRALKSPKREDAIWKSNTNERRNERTNVAGRRNVQVGRV